METAYVRATFAEFSWLGTGQVDEGALAARACIAMPCGSRRLR